MDSRRPMMPFARGVQLDADPDDYTVKIHVDPNAPWVFLFGWAGCQDRYLAKYSRIYEQNTSIVRFTAPINRVRSFASYRTLALELYEKILDQCSSQTHFVFHLFSMNGCTLFAALWDLLGTVANGPFIKQRTRGIMFDSSPANVSPWQEANAVSLASLPPSMYGAATRQSYRVLLATAFSLQRLTIWLRSQWEPNVYENNHAFFRLRALTDLPQNLLFLYSKNDEICTSVSIEEFMAAAKERRPSLRIESKCWFNSPHCQHLRAHPEEYSQLCRRFLSDCIREARAETPKS